MTPLSVFRTSAGWVGRVFHHGKAENYDRFEGWYRPLITRLAGLRALQADVEPSIVVDQ